MVEVDAEARKQRDRLRVAAGTSPHAGGSGSGDEVRHAPRVVGDYAVISALGHDEHAGGPLLGDWRA